MILFAADCHGDFEFVINAAAEATSVILLGDQEPQIDLVDALGAELAPKTWWIYGNHDSDDLCSFEYHAALIDRNLHCRVVEIEGVRIAGLGGVFRSKKFEVDQTLRLAEVDLDCPKDTREAWIKLRRGGLSHPSDFTTIFLDDIKRLLGVRGQVDVLVTHEAPESHALGFPLIGDIARALGVKMLIHGHHHERYSTRLDGGIRVEGLGMARTDESFFWLRKDWESEYDLFCRRLPW